MFSDRRYQEIAGILILLSACILLLSLSSYTIDDYSRAAGSAPVHNIIGLCGASISGFFRTAFGYSSFIFCAILGLAGWRMLRTGAVSDALERIFALLFLMLVSTALIALVLPGRAYQLSGGYIGFYQYEFLTRFMGGVGAALVILIFNLIGLILLGAFSVTAAMNAQHAGKIKPIFLAISAWIEKRRNRETASVTTADKPTPEKNRKPPWIEKIRIPVRGAAPAREDDLANARVRLLEFKKALSANEDTLSEWRTRYSDTTVITDIQASELNAEDPFPIHNSYDDAVDFSIEESIDADIIETEDEPGAFTATAQPPVEKNRITLVEDDLTAHSTPLEVRDGREISKTPSPTAPPVPRQRPDGGTPKPGAGELQQTFDFGGVDGAEASEVQRIFEEISINKEYIIPTAFLQSSTNSDAEGWKSEILKNSDLLVSTLRDFGIESRVVNVNRGPVITLYEMQIAPGIKVNRIVGLADDIAMALSGSRVRIVAPIPGKSAIGIEVPNKKREMVMLGDIINSKEYQAQSGFLKVALGKDILGKPIMLDLKKLPHLLIAGATGSGKSVCVNSIITSLIYNYDPNYVRFILVDPKMVELQLYNGIPHLLTPVIVEPHIAPKALKWAMYEMERRYKLLSQVSTRDIERYNTKISGYGAQYEKLPYIVIIMDELADLMMVAAKEIEGNITRLAQKARAVGIHLVLATQRPSVDVITGIIKANFPARIAFQVAQKTDSRTIIDQNGAEKLLGKGDMLYQSPMSSFPVRIQGAYISEEEVFAIVHHLRKIGNPSYLDFEDSIYDEDDVENDNEAEDELFVEALKIVEETKKASASYLQRRLSIGYNRAARIIELMEERGYIGAQQGSKPREVYI